MEWGQNVFSVDCVVHKFLFFRQIRQTGKILAFWQDFDNLARFRQPGKVFVGIHTCIRQSGKVLAIWQGFGSLATYFAQSYP
jgi:hypothetical protein